MVKKFLTFFCIMFCCCIFTVTDTQAYTAHTVDQSMSWLQSQIGQSKDLDGNGPWCVDLIAAYYQYLGVGIVWGDAYQYTSNTLPDPQWRRYQGIQPQRGDILVYTGGAEGLGHVAIYESDYETYHQRFDNHTYIEKVTAYKYNGFSGLTYWGVIRPDFKAPSTPDASIATKITVNGRKVTLTWTDVGASMYWHDIETYQENGTVTSTPGVEGAFTGGSGASGTLLSHEYTVPGTGRYRSVVCANYAGGQETYHYVDFLVLDEPDLTMERNSHRYLFYKINCAWGNAKAFCEENGGHLVTMNDQAEQDAILAFLNTNGNQLNFWLGATDAPSEGYWEWVTGEAFSFYNWADGEPNNYNNAEHYAAMYPDGRWIDLPYDTSTFSVKAGGFIMETELQYRNATVSAVYDSGANQIALTGSGFPVSTNFSYIRLSDGDTPLLIFPGESDAGGNLNLAFQPTGISIDAARLQDYRVTVYNNQGMQVLASCALSGKSGATGRTVTIGEQKTSASGMLGRYYREITCTGLQGGEVLLFETIAETATQITGHQAQAAERLYYNDPSVKIYVILFSGDPETGASVDVLDTSEV